MGKDDQHGFEQFVRQRLANLRRIAYETRGEYQLADVENVAWLMAHDMRTAKGIPIDFLDRDDQQLLLSYVYQELVCYSETQVRHAIRLDHDRTDDEDEHPLIHTLVNDGGRDPLADLLAREAVQQAQQADGGNSLAAAYASLLDRFGNKVRVVADFLLVSVSTVRRHYTRAIQLARHQVPLPLGHVDASRFRLGPWRRFRFQRIPVQLELPLVFDEELALGHVEK